MFVELIIRSAFVTAFCRHCCVIWTLRFPQAVLAWIWNVDHCEVVVLDIVLHLLLHLFNGYMFLSIWVTNIAHVWIVNVAILEELCCSTAHNYLRGSVLLLQFDGTWLFQGRWATFLNDNVIERERLSESLYTLYTLCVWLMRYLQTPVQSGLKYVDTCKQGFTTIWLQCVWECGLRRVCKLLEILKMCLNPAKTTRKQFQCIELDNDMAQQWNGVFYATYKLLLHASLCFYLSLVCAINCSCVVSGQIHYLISLWFTQSFAWYKV